MSECHRRPRCAQLVSVHLPKAAGTSIRRLLESWYGTEAVLVDTIDDPADPCGRFTLDPVGFRRQTESVELPPGIEVVHGHFHASKYRKHLDAKWITFLREPVDNLISIYFFWKKLSPGHALHRYFLDAGLDISQAAQLPTFRRLMTGHYFRDVDMRQFVFIGANEQLESECTRLAHLLGKPNLTPPRLNINTYPGYAEERRRITEDRSLMSHLRDLLKDDIEFYNRYAGTV